MSFNYQKGLANGPFVAGKKTIKKKDAKRVHQSKSQGVCNAIVKSNLQEIKSLLIEYHFLRYQTLEKEGVKSSTKSEKQVSKKSNF